MQKVEKIRRSRSEPERGFVALARNACLHASDFRGQHLRGVLAAMRSLDLRMRLALRSPHKIAADWREICELVSSSYSEGSIGKLVAETTPPPLIGFGSPYN